MNAFDKTKLLFFFIFGLYKCILHCMCFLVVGAVFVCGLFVLLLLLFSNGRLYD